MARTCAEGRSRNASAGSRRCCGTQSRSAVECETGGAERRRVPPRLQAWPRRHCQQADRLALSLWPIAALGQIEEPGCARGPARGGRGMGQVMDQITSYQDGSRLVHCYEEMTAEK